MLVVSLLSLYASTCGTPAILPLADSENVQTACHMLLDTPLYFGAGTILGSAAVLSGAAGTACHLFPQMASWSGECYLMSRMFGIAARQSYLHALRKIPLVSLFLKHIPLSHATWDANRRHLEQIPISNADENHLMHFLQKRWMAKTTGTFPFFVNWMCPAFSIPIQMHPESTNSYARDPANRLSETYKNRICSWKNVLPHPQEHPLILTRPCNIKEYLPHCFTVEPGESIEHCIARLAPEMQQHTVILDVSAADNTEELSHTVAKHQLDADRLLCIHNRILEENGIIRILPLTTTSPKVIEKQHAFLLSWISRFGLTANRVELDRPTFSQCAVYKTAASTPIVFASQAEWSRFLEQIDQRWTAVHPQKTILFKGTLHVLKDLCAQLQENVWDATMRSGTRNSIVQFSLENIRKELLLILKENEGATFQDLASRLEHVHADLMTLLEIFSPFTREDFPSIFRKHLTTIPDNLKSFTAYGLHSSGMTSLTGIFKAVEKSKGSKPLILYGENCYFECILAAELFAEALSVNAAQVQDLKEVDLILAQFNPALKRIHFKAEENYKLEYHVEDISSILRSVLEQRTEKPLTLAIDCTFDYSNSERINHLLLEFEKEIASGVLNVICFRSGLKFDLFGLDNYCGAPFFMIHNKGAAWSSFDALLSDPALQADTLSLNWFCLALQNAAPYLEAYRKQVFDNTHAVLNRIPKRLLKKERAKYRVIPMDADTDPTFIDIKVFGPLHAIRASLLVSGFLTIKCMEKGFPLLHRPGIGFYHPNLSPVFSEECTTIRLTIGLDPAQIDPIVQCFKEIDALNSS
jgi:hypothetical protein